MIKNSNESKEQALQSIATLIENFDISIKEIKGVITKGSKNQKDNSWINKLFGYIGAIFIFGGLSLLIGMLWGDLGSAARVIISYGSGICAFIFGFMFNKDERYQSLSIPFYLISTFLLPFGMFVFLGEYIGGNDAQLATIIVCGILAAQFALVYSKDQKTFLLFFAYLYFYISAATLLERIDIPRDLIGLIIGTSIVAFAIHYDKTKHKAISPFWYIIGIGTYLAAISNMMLELDVSGNFIGVSIGLSIIIAGKHFNNLNYHKMAQTFYILGCLGFLASLFDFVEGKAFIDLIFLGVAVLFLIASVQIKNMALLIISTIAIIGFLGYFTEEYFADIVGWPIALITLGFVLIGISAQAVKLGQKIQKKA